MMRISCIWITCVQVNQALQDASTQEADTRKLLSHVALVSHSIGTRDKANKTSMEAAQAQ